MANETIDNILDFLDKIKEEGEVTLKFRKKDKSIRVMRCTLDLDKIPKKDQPSDINLSKIMRLVVQNKVIHVYDLDKKGWRSVPYDRTEWLETKSNKRFSIKK